MSAFVVSNAHVDAIVTAGLELGRGGGKHWTPLTWQVPHTPSETAYQRGEVWGPTSIAEYRAHQRELTQETAGRVGAMLMAENVASVNHRYDEEDIEEPYVYKRFRRKMDAVQTIKAIDCLYYQSCEHPEWHNSEAKAFLEALKARAVQMVLDVCGYDDAEWHID